MIRANGLLFPENVIKTIHNFLSSFANRQINGLSRNPLGRGNNKIHTNHIKSTSIFTLKKK